MSANEIEHLAEAVAKMVKENKPAPAEGQKIVDIAFKFVSTASLAMVMWVFTSVNAMQQDMVQLSADASYMRQSLMKMDNFTIQPRFTQEMFDNQISPMVKSLTQNSEAIAALLKKSNDNDLKIQQLQIAVEKKR